MGQLSKKASRKQGLHYFLPRGRLEIEGKYNDVKASDGKTLVRREYVVTVKKYHVADPQAPVFAEITENVMYDEDTVISVKEGLLQSANAKPEDKTGEIIVTLVGTAIDVAKTAFGMPAGGIRTLNKNVLEMPKLKPVTPFLVDFDPLNEKDVGTARAVIERAGFTLSMPGKITVAEDVSGTQEADVEDGLAYRRPTALRVLIELKEHEFEYQDEMEKVKVKEKDPAGQEKEVEKIVVKVPANGAKMYRSSLTVPDVRRGMVCYVPVRRGFMTKRQTNVTFDSGEPTQFDLKAPSPVLGFVKLPASIAKMAADAVPTLIKVSSDASKGEITRQTELIKAQSDLIKAQNDLNSLKAAQATP